MTDIVIRGMEMPKDCLYCHFVSYDNDHCVAMDKDIPIYDTVPEWCPLAPLPEGHGRLIDVDALGDFPYNISFCDEGDIENWIASAPTIVPAEGGGEDG